MTYIVAFIHKFSGWVLAGVALLVSVWAYGRSKKIEGARETEEEIKDDHIEAIAELEEIRRSTPVDGSLSWLRERAQNSAPRSDTDP